MRSQRTMVLLAVLCTALLTVGLARGAPPANGASAQSMDEPAMDGPAMAGDAMALDAEICSACHEDLVAAFAANPHTALDREGMDERYGAAFSCAGCHGDVSNHVEEGGGEGNVFAFSGDNPHTANAARCLECHADTHPRFLRSPHALAGMACQSCHTIHGEDGSGATGWALLKSGGGIERPMEKVGAASRLCASCHAGVFTQFELNERHRLREGTLECQSCHDPHAPANRLQLGGFKQAACAECHADKEGPFVFEHGASRVEGCVACHTPHGSPNRHQLKFQRVAELCYSCHAAVPGFHSRFSLDTVCTNCHSSIHGSNFHQAFLK